MMGPAACLFAAASPLVHSPYVATGLITLGMGLSALTCSKYALLTATGHELLSGPLQGFLGWSQQCRRHCWLNANTRRA